jgi:hypothetical protein
MPVVDRLDVIDVQAREVEHNKASSDAVELVYTPHPMLLIGQEKRQIKAGLTLAEMLQSLPACDGVGEAVVTAHGYALCVGGVPVAQEHWHLVRVKPGQLVEVRPAARYMVIPYIFEVAYAWATAAAFATGLVIVGYLVYAAVIVGAALLINRLMKPPKREGPGQNRAAAAQSNGSSAAQYSITGTANSARPYEMVPITFGSVRVTFDYLGLPYTALESGDQIFYGNFCAGVNAGNVYNLMFGNTPVSNFTSVDLRYRGWGVIPDQTLLAWGNVDTLAGGQHVAAPPYSNPITRTSSAGAVYLVLDYEGSCFGLSSQGGFLANNFIDIYAEYRLVGSSTWLPFINTTGLADASTNAPISYYDLYSGGVSTTDNDTGIVTFAIEPTKTVVDYISGAAYAAVTKGTYPNSIRYYNVETTPMRISLGKSVPLGQYEVRSFKLTLDVDDVRQQNKLTLLALKTVQAEPVNYYEGMGVISMRAKATGQLNGAIENFTAMVDARPIPVWDGTGWGVAYSSNPGAILLAWLRGHYATIGGVNTLVAGYGLPDVQLDIESFKAFMSHCSGHDYRFDYHLKDLRSNDEMAELMVRCGMGAITQHTGKVGVIFFAGGQPVESVVNMANIKLDSFSVDFFTGQTADELQVSYLDGRGSAGPQLAKTLRIQSPVSNSFDNIGRISLDGATREGHVAELGRFAMAQNVYQRKAINFEMDLEYLSFHRGSVVALSHDLTQWGYSGRLRSAVNNSGVITLELDELVPATNPAGSSVLRKIGLRILGEQSYRVFTVAAFTGQSRVVQLVEGWPSGVALPGTVATEQALECLWIYDFKATPGLRVRVTDIKPMRNMAGAAITVVPEPDVFWDYVYNGSYVPPANSSLLNRALPVITGLDIAETLRRQGNTFFTDLSLSIRSTGNFAYAEVFGMVGMGAMRLLGQTLTGSFAWKGTVDDEWTIQVRPYDGLGRLGTPLSGVYKVKGLREKPSDPASLSIIVTDAGYRVTWPENVDVDRSRAWLRKGTTWASAQALGVGGREIITDTTDWPLGWLPSGVLNLVLKYLDTTDNESVNAASAIITIQPPSAPVITARSEANKVYIQWGDAKTSQPILRYEYRVAKVVGGVPVGWAAAGSAGSDSRSDNIPFFEAALWRIEITAVDVAGNRGPAATTDVPITLPDDFKSLLNVVSTFNGAMVNAAKTGANNRVTFPLNATETWTQHFTSRGWSTIQDQLNAGYPLYYQPGVTTGSYTETFDAGAVFSGGTIVAQLQTAALAGAPTVSIRLGYKKLIGDAWTLGSVGSLTLLAGQFRYVQVVVTATSTAGFDLAEIVNLQVGVNVQQITENVTVSSLAADVNGTLFTTTRGFTDVKELQLTLVFGSLATRAEARVVDVGAPGVPATLFIYAFNAAGTRVNADVMVNISGV